MKPDEIKKSIDSIKPDEYLKTRLKAKISERSMPKKSKKAIISAVSVTLCLALVVSAISYSPQKDNTATGIASSSNVQNSEGSKIRGGVIVAYANDSINKQYEDVEISDQKYLSASYPPMCKIGAIDIRGKSEGEIIELEKSIKEDFNRIEKSTEAGSVYFCMTTHCERFNNALIYQANCGMFDFDLDEESYKDVKEIRVSNENTDYAYMEITAMDAWYDEDLNRKEDGINYTKSTYIASYLDDYVDLSGDRYRRCMELNKNSGNNFGVRWKMNTELYDRLNDNPNEDLTKIVDTLTFEVEFYNGEIVKSVVKISFDNDGYMHCKGESVETLNAK